MGEYTPIEVAIALALYHYNVSPAIRAQKLWEHFNGDSMEMNELLDVLVLSPGNLATEFPYPTAKVYVQHALERYGHEACGRVAANERG
jgi:hypothetical protein